MKKVILILIATLSLTFGSFAQFPNINKASLFGGIDSKGSGGFGKSFAGFLVYQNFDLAMKFTSKESIKKHGHEAILKFYKTYKFNYKLTTSSESIDGKYTTLRYKTNETATGVTKDFVVIVENDSCKLVLPDNLKDFLK